ncbi:MAG TPA: DEAD/DEAH box helicase [Acidimicrobiales bacterium]|nr:DEAD/DEAH box helicase [Acidimicrobiales bacterium]
MSPSFAEIGVPADLATSLVQRGITEPFAIQAATIPDAMAGRDVCGKAPTGSGKTLAFGLPLVARIGKAKPRQPRALVLVPTRELAAQVAAELKPLAALRGRSVAAFYGGTSYGPQRKALQSGCTIVVACPGRLEDLIDNGDLTLAGVDRVVIDEADRMADMGFLPVVQRLLDQVKPDRQTLLFSATLDGVIDGLVRRYQRDPVRHELETPEEATGDVQHRFWRVDRSERVTVTAQLLQREWPAIVFCRTRHGADRVAAQLKNTGVDAVAIHGDRSQSQRERALAAFKSGKAQALVATDVAARGIHVDDVACVVHFDPPADSKDYVHRSGRTGRAGADGLVVSLVHTDVVSAVKNLQRKLGHPLGTTAPELTGEPPARRVPTVPAPTPTPRHRPRPAASRSTRGPRQRSGASRGRRRR